MNLQKHNSGAERLALASCAAASVCWPIGHAGHATGASAPWLVSGESGVDDGSDWGVDTIDAAGLDAAGAGLRRVAAAGEAADAAGGESSDGAAARDESWVLPDAGFVPGEGVPRREAGLDSGEEWVLPESAAPRTVVVTDHAGSAPAPGFGRVAGTQAVPAWPESSPVVWAAAQGQMLKDGVELLAEPAETLVLPIGHSRVIEPGWMVKEISVANDKVADVRIVSPTRVLVVGSAPGTTDLRLWGANGEQWQTKLLVEVDVEEMRRTLMSALPGSRLELRQTRDVLVVTGTIPQAEHAEALRRFLEAAGAPYVDMTRVAGVPQVQIRVRVAEANRVALRSLGINGFHTSDTFFAASTIGGNPNSIGIGVPNETQVGNDLPFQFQGSPRATNTTTFFAGFPGIELELFFEALEDNQYVRTLAEPTLVALSGEKASFLAGGEFPIPVPQGSGIGGTTITIDYKEFGVRLNFVPTVLGDGAIRMQVAPEVSELSDIGAIELQGFTIPSLVTRRAATTLVMRSGQTFAMAGLISRSTVARSQRVPGLSRIPILGPLFRSVRYEQGDTELLVLATVELVEPLDTTSVLPMPGDAHVRPNEWELYAEGRLDGAAPRMAPEPNWLRDTGLERLRGPTGWADPRPQGGAGPR